MHNVGMYAGTPSRTTIRQMYANTEAEKVGAGAIEADPKARAVVDDVNIVLSDLKRLDQTGIDTDADKGSVSIDATPKKLNFFQKITGAGSTPVEDIAAHASEHGDVSNIAGTLDEKEMDVSVSFANKPEPLVYSKQEDELGNVFFQRGNETVGVDAKGNLVMQTLGD